MPPITSVCPDGNPPVQKKKTPPHRPAPDPTRPLGFGLLPASRAVPAAPPPLRQKFSRRRATVRPLPTVLDRGEAQITRAAPAGVLPELLPAGFPPRPSSSPARFLPSRTRPVSRRNMSHTNVQPMEMAGPGLLPVGQQPGVRMHNIPGKPGTLLGLVFRCIQFVCAIISCVVMANTNFTHSPTFSFLVAAAGLMFLWSFSLAILDLYALLVRRHLRRTWLDCFFTVGDAITGLLLYTAASMSGGFSKFTCKPIDCARITTSTVFAY